MKNPCGVSRRIFPRYRFNSECSVTIAGETRNALVTDFSLTGVGVFIKDLHRIEAPDVTINISGLDLASQAKIVWSKELFSGLRCGLRCVGQTAGNLSHFRFPDLLIGLKKSNMTGILNIEHRHSLRRLFFRQGDVIFASSNLEAERMGDMLLDIGRLSRAQFEESVEVMRKTGKRQGTVLVELGHLSPAELIWAVQYQVEKIIHNLFALQEGRFVFYEEPLPLNEVITLQLSTGNLVYRGSKSLNDTDKILRVLPPGESVLCVSPEDFDPAVRTFLDDNDRKILSLIDGNVTVQDILSLSPLPETETLKSMIALFNARIIGVDEKGMHSIAEEAAGEMPQDSNAVDDPAFAEMVQTLYGKHKRLDYYSILEVDRDASHDEIKKAYHKRVREYHPDRHSNIRSEELRKKLNAIFARINEAYRMLSKAQNGQPVATPQQQTPEKIDNRELAKIRFREGIISFKASNFENAMTLFGQAAYLDNSVPEYHYYYGKTLLSKKKIKDAEESIKKAVQLSPENADFIAELGHIYLELGFKTRAKNTFEKALRFNPHHEKASAGLAQISR